MSLTASASYLNQNVKEHEKEKTANGLSEPSSRWLATLSPQQPVRCHCISSPILSCIQTVLHSWIRKLATNETLGIEHLHRKKKRMHVPAESAMVRRLNQSVSQTRCQ